MTGSASSTRSPSKRTTTRSTPCVDGCWGPMLSTMSPVEMSRSISAVMKPFVSIAPVATRSPREELARPRLLDARAQHRVLPHWIALVPVGQQQPPKSRVAGEVDAEQLPGLAFVPVGAGVHLHRRGHARLRPRHAALERDARVSFDVGDLVHELHTVFVRPVDAAAPRVVREPQ